MRHIASGRPRTVVETGVALGLAPSEAVRVAAQIATVVKQALDGPKLTPKEREVLARIVEGDTNAELARVLGISAWTAKFHTANLLRKLGAKNRAHLVTLAFRTGRAA
jgi:DNA-binding CsgD family transcriptional regulator